MTFYCTLKLEVSSSKKVMDIINCECIANVITCLFKASHVMGLPISNLVVVFSL